MAVLRSGLHFRISCRIFSLAICCSGRNLFVLEIRSNSTASKKPLRTSPKVLVVDLIDPGLDVIKLRITWWTQSQRQHEMIASHDRVLTAIGEAMRRR